MRLPLIYFRRTDISAEQRMQIGFSVTYQKRHGQVTKLAKRYKVSRRFIYSTGDALKAFVAQYDAPESKAESAAKAVDATLRLLFTSRLAGKCTINGIRKILQQQGSCYDSVGYISEALTAAGEKVGNSLSFETTMTFVFVPDEIFALGCPILITVEPSSLAVLKIELADDRTAATWQAHFEGLEASKIRASLVVKDEGGGLKAAQKACLADVPVQSDTFHAVAHRFGLFTHRFWASFEAWLAKENKAADLYFKSKTVQTEDKRYKNYLLVRANRIKALALFHDFNFLYKCLLDGFQAFDGEGQLKDEDTVVADFDTALDLLRTLKQTAINKELDTIIACKSTLFTFFKSTKNMVAAIEETIEKVINKTNEKPIEKPIEKHSIKTILNYFCLAYQHHKNCVKAKKQPQRAYHKTHENDILNLLHDVLKDDFNSLKILIYSQLSSIVQSSAAVECINSILRPYLNSSCGQLTQQALNLFMFYHNHRIFEAGARKGKSPMELLTGKPHDNWLDLLMAKIATK